MNDERKLELFNNMVDKIKMWQPTDVDFVIALKGCGFRLDEIIDEFSVYDYSDGEVIDILHDYGKSGCSRC